MKSQLILILCVISVSCALANEEENLTEWQDFSTALQNWREVEETITAAQPASQSTLATAAQEVFVAWESLPEQRKSELAASLNLIRFKQAKLAASKSDWNAALQFLRMEAEWQHAHGTTLMEQTKDPSRFFEDLIILQSLVLSHTGVQETLGPISYPFISVSGNQLFAAARRTRATEEFGIDTPPLTEAEERTIILLVTRTGSGDYIVSSRAQVVGSVATPPQLAVEGTPPTLSVSPVTKDVTLTEGIPTQFTPRANPVKEYQIQGTDLVPLN